MDETDRDNTHNTLQNDAGTPVEKLVSDARRIQSAALFVALITAGALVAIPLPGTPVPIVLQNAFVVLTGLVLAPAWAALTVGVYLLLGAIGLPVFAGATGGLAHFAGPTGGFLVGYLPAVFVTAIVYTPRTGRSRVSAGKQNDDGTGRGATRRGDGTRFERSGIPGTIRLATAVASGFLVPYLLGVPRLAMVASLSLPAAISAAMIPFLPGDLVKGILVFLIIRGIPGTVWRRLR